MELRGSCQRLAVILLVAFSQSLTLAAPSAAKDELSKIIQERRDAEQQWAEASRKAKTDAEQSALKYPTAENYSPRVLALAQKYPDDPAALEALIWIAQNCRRGDELDTALRSLLEKHVNEPKIRDVSLNVLHTGSKEAEGFLRGVSEKSSSDEARGTALITLGRLLKNYASSSQFLCTNTDPKYVANYGRWLGEDVVTRLKAANPDDLRIEAEKTFEGVIEKYGGQKSGSRKLGESAKGELFEMRNLTIGKVAPEITGKDVDGHKFALSDYRGKVVVLDFWGHW
jgi:hypothetical protein